MKWIEGEAKAAALGAAVAALALLLPLPLPRATTHDERVLARAEVIIIRGGRNEKERKAGKEFFFFEIE